MGLTADELIAAVQAGASKDAVTQDAVREAIAKIEDVRRRQADQSSTGVNAAANTWHHFTIPRKRFKRIGSTAGKNWSTVKAIKLVYKAVTGSTGVVRYDTIVMKSSDSGKSLSGIYQVRVQFVREGTDYIEKSPISAASANINLTGQGLTITMPASMTASLTAGENYYAYVYIFGGLLDKYYYATKQQLTSTRKFRIDEFDRYAEGSISVLDRIRFATFGFSPGDTGFVPGSSFSFTVQTSEIDLYLTNIPAELTDTAPPDDIIGIAGPYSDRLHCLTSDGVLHISRVRIIPCRLSKCAARTSSPCGSTWP